MNASVLLGDLSGSDCLKLALGAVGRRPGNASEYSCRSVEELDAALSDFLSKNGNPALMAAAFSACGWENEGGLSMPNHTYTVKRSWLQERLNVRRIHLVNDCVSKAMAVEHLRPEEQFVICGPQADPYQMRALIGSSLGLGTVAIFTDDLNRPMVLPCEGGHTDLPATTDREYAVIRWLAKRYGHASRERAVSVLGLADVWLCLHELGGDSMRPASAQDIVNMARNGNPLAQEAIALVLGWLAATSADVALMTGARGGIYLSGGLVDLIGDIIDPKAFEARFTEKGRLSSYLKDIPVQVVRANEPEILGLSTLFT